MKCEEWISYLPWYLNGSLEPELFESLSAHLEQCDSCNEQLEQTQFAAMAYADHPPSRLIVAKAHGEKLDADILLDLDHHLEQCASCRAEFNSAARSNQRMRRLGKGFFGLRFAAVLVFGLGLGFLIGNIETGPRVPSSNIMAIDLMPDSQATRGPITETSLPTDAEGLHIILNPKASASNWEALLTRHATTILHVRELKQLPDGTVGFVVPIQSLSPGRYTLKLSAGTHQELFRFVIGPAHRSP